MEYVEINQKGGDVSVKTTIAAQEVGTISKKTRTNSHFRRA